MFRLLAFQLVGVLAITGMLSAVEHRQGSEPAAAKVGKDCCFKGRKLYGKIKFVTSFPDIKIKVVDSFPDLKVKHVSSFPDRCGLWQIVESFPDLKVQLVESFPDITIKYVESFPGLP
jgi:hypothetical protein